MKPSNPLRDAILSKRTPKSRLVTPSFLKDSEMKDVEIRIMTVERRAAMITASEIDGERDAAAYEAMIVIETCFIPGTDDKVFTEADRDTLRTMPADVLDELAEPALEINGLLLTAVAGAEKN